MVEKIIKRDGNEAEFSRDKITNAIFKAASSVGGNDRDTSEKLTDKVVSIIDTRFVENSPTVEQVQDVVEEVLIKEGHDKTAKSYILYRAKRAELRAAAEEASRGNDKERASLMHMFAHKSKLASKIGYDRLEAYKNILFSLREAQASGKLPVSKDYLNGNELATSMYKKKYFLKDLDEKLIEKKPEDVFARMAAFMAAVEDGEKKQLEWAEKYYLSLYNGSFLPGGRVIAGAGDLYRLKTLANCFVSVINKDNIESIYKAAYECARTYSYGGGIGVDISSLRPRDSIVHNAADKSTGAVSFMELFSLTTGLIGQSGRRGALMLTVDIKHPDSPLFINVKKIPNWVTNQIVQQFKWSGNFSDTQMREAEQFIRENTQVRFANISIKVSDEFMRAVEEQNTHNNKILIYRKDSDVSSKGVQQTGSINYSYGIPAKPIEKYELMGTFDSVEGANVFLKENGTDPIEENSLEDESTRDMFGDLLVKSPAAEYDFAIKKAGDFMLYFASPEAGEIKRLVKAREVWNSFIEGNYKTAEPGLQFWSTMIKYSPSNYIGIPIASTNPCGEINLEDGGACNLAALNLSRFVKNGYTDNAEVDWEKLKEETSTVARFLDNVVTWNETLNPLEKQRRAAKETRRLGIGVMGIADMLNQLNIGYDDPRAMELMEKAAKLISNESYATSANLSEERGVSPVFNYSMYSKSPYFNESLTRETRDIIRAKGLRNIAILTIAPTGSISNLIKSYEIGDRNFIGVSGGIEPIFALYYTRRTEGIGHAFYKMFHSTVDAYIVEKGLSEKAKQATTDAELKELLPEHFFRTSHKINPEQRVKIQGLWQKYIDHSISSTINLPEDVNPEVISKIYLDAWKNGLKGLTVYREGSRYPILSTEGEETEFQNYKEKAIEVEVDGKKQVHKGGEIVTLEDGRIMTAYHIMKEQQKIEEPPVIAAAVEKKEE